DARLRRRGDGAVRRGGEGRPADTRAASPAARGGVVRLDTANRSFATLAGAGLLAAMLVFCGGVGCVLVGLVVTQVGRHGVAAFSAHGHIVLPALAFIVVVGACGAVGLWSLSRPVRD